MSITAFFLRNRHAVWAMVVAIMIIGVVAYRQIPVRLFPDTAPPLVNVVTAWPGATASDVDTDLTEVLETEFAALQGVARTSSTSQDNLSLITIEFVYGTEVDLAAVDVQNAVSRIGADLPAASQQPRVLTFSTADRPIYTVGIAADDLLVARRLAEDVVATRIQAVAGVAAVDVFGGRVPTVLIDVDPHKAEAHKVSLRQIAGTVRSGNLSLPAGRLRGEHTETMLRVDQRAERVEQLEDLPLRVMDGGQIRLGSLATIVQGAEQDDSWFSIGGERAIAVQVYRSEDANTVAVVEEVTQVVADLQAEFPGLVFIPGEESASFTEQSVANLLSNVWQALFLASGILFLFLGRGRAALITAFTMPLAFGLTFAAMWILGMEFNMVTLSAVILAVGMVVDASVVVLENIVRLRDEGYSPMDAAREGTDQVILPVMAGAATTLVVLVPLLTLPGFVGKVFGPLATTLLIAFFSSVIVALVLVPILSLQISEGGRFEEWSARISRPFQRAMDWLRDAYMTVLNAGLNRRGAVVVVALVSFVIGIAGIVSAGMDVLPRMDSGAFSVSLETPSGSSLSETTKAVQQVEAIVAKIPEVTLVQAQAGYEPGMKFSGSSGVMGPTQGFISVTLSPRTDRERTIWEIEEGVRAEIARIPNLANVVVKEVGNTAKPTTMAPLVARVSGPDPLVLDTLGDELLARMSGVPALVQPTRTWRRDMKRVLLSVDPREATALGQSPLGVAQTLASGAEGIDAGIWRRPGVPAEPIQVRFSRSDNPDQDELLSWPISVPGTAETVPLRAITDTRIAVEQGLFTSENLSPVLDIRTQIQGKPLSFAVADAQAAIADMELPAGYTVSIEGENNDLIESRESILSALAVSIVAVYLLLVSQFRSWVHPITVMMAVPLSLVGVSIALWWGSRPVSMPVMVGLVLLVGTVVNNAILLIDIIRQHRDDGMERHQAIREGVSSRFRPIMMTSLSTVIGMVPLAMEWALGAERFSPLAAAVIGGLLASTLLTLIVIPVLYDIGDSLSMPQWTRTATATVTAVLLAIGLTLQPGVAQAQDLTLDQAWSLAESHPAIQASGRLEQAAQANAHAATARMLPQAEASARASKLSYVEPALIEIPIQLPDGSTPEPVPFGDAIEAQYSLNVSVTQPLFTGGALLNGRKAARAGADAASAGAEQVRADLWLAVVKGWYGLAVAEDVVSTQGQVVVSAQAREASVQRLMNAGRATDLEVAAVSLKRAEAEQRLASAERSAAVAASGLQALLGEPVSAATVDVVAIAREAASQEAVTGTSSAIRQAESQADAAQAKANATTGSLVPTVAARFGATYANPNSRYFPPTQEWNGSWDASVIATWKLDGVRWHNASAARMEAQAAKLGLEARQRENQVALARAQAPIDTALQQLDLAADRVAMATRAVQATEQAQAEGRASNAQVLERSYDLAMAKVAEQRVALDVVVAVETARTLAGLYGPVR